MPFFIGKKGCGKSVILDWLVEMVFGIENCQYISHEVLAEKFNSFCDDKFLILIDEFEYDRKTQQSVKSLVTNKKVGIRDFQKKVIQKDNYSHFWGNSNQFFETKEDDRRPQFFEFNDKHKGNRLYYKDFIENYLTQEVTNHFISMLLFDKELASKIEEYDFTDNKSDLFKQNCNNFVKQYVEWVIGYYNDPENASIITQPIKVIDLIKKYRDLVKDNSTSDDEIRSKWNEIFIIKSIHKTKFYNGFNKQYFIDNRYG